MAPEQDLWDAQLRRLLAGYREPELDGRRLDAIGRRVSEKLKEDGVLEGNLESLLPQYEEPSISQDRLDRIGDHLAGMLKDAPPVVRRRPSFRSRPGGEVRGFVWAAAAIAAGILIALTMKPTEPTRSTQPLLTPLAEKTAPVPPPRPEPIPEVRPEPPPPPPRTAPPTPEPPKPEPQAPPPAAPVVPLPAPERKPAPTVVATAPATLAVVERVEGAVEWVNGAALAAGEEITARGPIQTGPKGRAIFKYKDGTRLDLGAGSTLHFLAPPSGAKELSLPRGALAADVAPQPAGKPLVIATPLAEARVLGTSFLISAESASTQLTVREGKVRFTRKPDGAVVDVAAGNTAIAARGVALLTRPIPEESKRIMIEVEELASARGTKPADGMVRRLFLEPFDTAAGGSCVSAPAAGMEAAGDFKLAKGTWYVWVRYRDEPGMTRIGFTVLLGDQVLGQMSTPGRDRSWIWKRVAFPWNGGAARITLRSTFDGIKATPDRPDFRQSPYGALNRWDRLCLTPDEAFTPE